MLYEIGLAKGKGLIILPFLTHQSIDMPYFISSINCVSTLSDVEQYFNGALRGITNFQIDMKLETAHYCFLKFAAKSELSEDLRNRIGITHYDVKSTKTPQIYELPMFLITVQNKTSNYIEIRQPMIEGDILLPDNNRVDAISFPIMRNDYIKLEPKGTFRFQLTGKIVNYIIKSLLEEKISNIYIENIQENRSYVSFGQILDAKIYCNKYFSDITHLNEITRKYGN